MTEENIGQDFLSDMHDLKRKRRMYEDSLHDIQNNIRIITGEASKHYLRIQELDQAISTLSKKTSII